MARAKKLTFEQSLQRLEEIVAQLERGEASLEQSLSLFEEGTKLTGDCTRLLDTAEQKVTQITKGADGAPVEAPLRQEAGDAV